MEGPGQLNWGLASPFKVSWKRPFSPLATEWRSLLFKKNLTPSSQSHNSLKSQHRHYAHIFRFSVTFGWRGPETQVLSAQIMNKHLVILLMICQNVNKCNLNKWGTSCSPQLTDNMVTLFLLFKWFDLSVVPKVKNNNKGSKNPLIVTFFIVSLYLRLRISSTRFFYSWNTDTLLYPFIHTYLLCI